MVECMSFARCQELKAKTGQLMCHNSQYDYFVSYEVIAGVHIGYLAVVYTIIQLMKNRNPFNLKWTMQVFNAAQIIVSAWMALGLSPILRNWVFNFNSPTCASVEFWVFVQYLTKYLDMLDTVWMALRKKNEQITFLHVYHHATIGVIWGLLLNFGHAGGVGAFGGWINSVVHVIMYTHYLVTSMGYQNPLKKYITQIQMTQFCICVVHGSLIGLIETQTPWQWGPPYALWEFSLFLLFKAFYSQKISAKSTAAVVRKKYS